MRNAFIRLAVAGVVTGGAMVTAMAQPASAADVDCNAFSTQAAAQEFFLANDPARDPNRLDADHDGIACEGLPPPTADVDCDAFSTQAAAQEFFLANDPARDPNRLDADHDGIACEAGGPSVGPGSPHPTVSAQSVAPVPRGGVQAGAGGAARPDGSNDNEMLPAAVAVGGAALLGGAAVVRRRRGHRA